MVEGLITQPRNFHWGSANAVCAELLHVIEAVSGSDKCMMKAQLQDQILGLVLTQRAILGWILEIDNRFPQDLAHLILRKEGAVIACNGDDICSGRCWDDSSGRCG